MPLTRVDTGEAERGQRIARQAAALDANCARWTWQISQLAKLLPLFRSRRIRRGVWRWIRGYLHDYRKANWRTGEQEIDVAQAIDFDIPFDKTALADYLSVIMIWVAGINILRREFDGKVIADIEDCIDQVATFYPEAAEIFSQAQTTFDRGEDEGLSFKLLRFIDKSRNAAPSLHVEATAYAYSCLTGVIERQALAAGDDPAIYEPVANILFKKTVRIFEAVLLVKQHVVRDVGVGLALLTSKGKAFFPMERGHKMIDAMFERDSYGIDKAKVQAVREAIKRTYNEVVAEITASPDTAPSKVVISYLRKLKNPDYA